MIVAAGLLLGAGVLLVVSPWLWPASATRIVRPKVLDGLRVRLTQAGLGRVAVGVPIAVSVLVGVALGAVVLAVAPVPALALGAAAVGASIPLAVLGVRARALRKATRVAWPDLVDHLVAGIRAGVPLAEAVGALAEVGPVETRAAFRAFERRALGSGNLASALDGLKADLADPVADRIVETLKMAREVGGSELPSILRALATSLRADLALRSEVEARQSWVRGAARLGVVAPWVVLVMLASRPEAAAAYNTPAGLALLGIGLALTVVAYRIMIALGRLPEERRWFA
ncbi:MAG: type II secretion system F family protein [Pseudolysinimonas sp.]